MYRYETHMHSAPVSRCARATVRESLEYYKKLGYDGVFVTNHFLDGNVNIDPSRPYEEKINFFFSDYEEALSLSEEIGIKVFGGVELSYYGIDFLVYGLDKEWYLQHPEIMEMTNDRHIEGRSFIPVLFFSILQQMPEKNPYAASSKAMDMAVGNIGGIVNIIDLSMGENAPAANAYPGPHIIPQRSTGMCMGENMLFI